MYIYTALKSMCIVLRKNLNPKNDYFSLLPLSINSIITAVLI